MNRETTVLVTLVVYKIVLVSIGILAQRKTRDGTDFFLGGRRLGGLVAGVSASASSSSAWTLLAVSASAFKWGLGALWIFPACVGGFALNWCVVAPALRRFSHRTGTVTLTDVLVHSVESCWRRRIQWVASVIILLSLGAYVAAQFSAAGKSFHETFGLSNEVSILVGAAIVVFYTMLGGFWAVSLTDTLQGLLMAAAAVVLPVAALSAVGGFQALGDGMQSVKVDGYMSLTRGMLPVSAIGMVLGLLGIGLGYPGQPHVVNRFMALEDEASLARGRVIAISWATVVYSGMLLLGLCGRVLYKDIGDAESVFFHATNELFSPVMSGVILAAVLSAIMSTADSQLLVAASSVTHDLARGPVQAADMLFRSRIVVLCLSAAAAAMAIFVAEDIFGRVLFAWFAVGSAFGPLLLVALLRGPVSGGISLLAMIVGFGTSVLAHQFPATKGTAIEAILPFVLGLSLALWGSRRSAPVDS